MSLVSGMFSVNCSNCPIVLPFASENSDFEISSSNERQMGIENQYTWETSLNCDCGNEIEIVYDIWEYPTGLFNNATIDVSGGTAYGEFEYDLSEKPEPEED